MEVQAELLKRSLYRFVRAAWEVIESSPYIDGRHIEAVCDHLQAVYEGRITNLIINIPPGCSKSLVSGVFFPAWVWSQDPTKRLFHASYDVKLSTRDSVKCRALLESPWYQSHFPGMVEFSKDQNQKTYYENKAGGWRLATSVSGHGTGQHPDVVITDDPNNAKQAESPAERQAVIDWWSLTISTRGVSRGVCKVVIQQRLHESDLTGYCLEHGGYDHLCLPMRFEEKRPPTSIGFVDWRESPGELLSPRQFSEKQVTQLEKELGPYGTAGQLQQRPVPRSGGMFDVSKLEIVDAAPLGLKECRSWDTGATEGGGDPTVGVRIGKDLQTGIYYISDVVRGQWRSDKRKAMQKQTADLDYAYPICRQVTQIQQEEPGSAGKEQSADFTRLMSGYSVVTIRETGAKEVRADPFASQVNAGNVKLVRGEWNREFLEELKLAPNGKHDDQWDAAATGFNWLEGKQTAVFLPQGWTFGGG